MFIGSTAALFSQYTGISKHPVVCLKDVQHFICHIFLNKAWEKKPIHVYSLTVSVGQESRHRFSGFSSFGVLSWRAGHFPPPSCGGPWPIRGGLLD